MNSSIIYKYSYLYFGKEETMKYTLKEMPIEERPRERLLNMELKLYRIRNY